MATKCPLPRQRYARGNSLPRRFMTAEIVLGHPHITVAYQRLDLLVRPAGLLQQGAVKAADFVERGRIVHVDAGCIACRSESARQLLRQHLSVVVPALRSHVAGRRLLGQPVDQVRRHNGITAERASRSPSGPVAAICRRTFVEFPSLTGCPAARPLTRADAAVVKGGTASVEETEGVPGGMRWGRVFLLNTAAADQSLPPSCVWYRACAVCMARQPSTLVASPNR